jgi:hypothetical protein
MTTPVSPSPPLSVVYCTDEHIAIRAPDDFLLICPGWQQLAAGTDGFIGRDTPSVLSSPSTDFYDAGVRPGHVVLLTAPSTRFTGGGELYAIESVAEHRMTLRRLGKPAGQGKPPGMRGATLNGVVFTINTLDPQIEDASFWANTTFGINPQLAGRAPANVYDLRDLRDFTVLTVICRRLQAQVNPSAGSAGTIRLQVFQQELSEVRARVQLRWNPTDSGGVPPPTSPFSTRFIR